ncbi:MAG: Helicase associated domain protein [Clostridia bacterium]
MEEILLNEIAESIGNDNKSVEELIDNIMQRVEWTRTDEKRWKKLTPEQRERLIQPTYLVRRIAEIRYAKDNLRDIVYENLKRAQGNLGDKDKMMGLYDTLEKFNYSCPYSDTLLIGGEQPIHIDHIIPVAMGGPTDDWNCIPVCGRCNMSKHDKHLLDWWQYNRTAEEEYKLVRIFEHITSKLLDNTNQIRYVETKDNTKHLDVITFLKQLLDHIEQNKQYILGPNSSILDDNSKAIESKLKELKKTFESVVKKNNDKTLKTDKQYFKEQKAMLKYVKGLGIRSYYKIAYTYFNEIQEMLNNRTSEEEIRQFCFDRDDSFNFTWFYEKLIEYKESHNGSFAGVTQDKEIGKMVSKVRMTVKGKHNYKLTQEMIDKLNAIGFPWEREDWFTPFYEKLIEYKEKHNGSFAAVTQDKEIGNTVSVIRQAFKGRGNINLTQEMIDKLNAIGFPWEVPKEDRYKDWFTPFYEKLIKYKEKKGSFESVTRDKEIGKIVSSIRQSYKGKGRGYQLTQEMIDKLNAIGFPWEVSIEDRFKDWFTPFYEKLIEYKEENGSFADVTKDKEIGNTINSVRQAYKGKGTTKLTQEMIDKLNAIGFPWEAENRDWFTPFYEKLIKYRDSEIFDNKGKVKKAKGSFEGVASDKEIGNTIDRIRQAYKGKGSIKLTQEMIDKLNAIGFPWEARAKKVQEDVLSV